MRSTPPNSHRLPSLAMRAATVAPLEAVPAQRAAMARARAEAEMFTSESPEDVPRQSLRGRQANAIGYAISDFRLNFDGDCCDVLG
eukprot:s126_g42.t1